MRLADFDYRLPSELIAQRPADPRDASRLLILDRATGRITHRTFSDIGQYLVPGDVLIINDTRVLPARLRGRREGSQGMVEVLLLRPAGSQAGRDPAGPAAAASGDEADRAWEALVRPGRRLREGARVEVDSGAATIQIGERLPDGRRLVRRIDGGTMLDAMRRAGEAPVPPYIETSGKDHAITEAYQTVYAREDGAVAAPTAGLHFTGELLARIRGQGVEVVALTLHVGLGTFQPVTMDDVRTHRMDVEFYTITPQAADTINARRGRAIAVGTTTVRTLETAARPPEAGGSEGVGDRRQDVRAESRWTDLFIYPGFRFRVVDALVTNFHLPRSTLLMLVSAFAGRETILRAYEEAIRERYRFYSFGDAMLIV
jgi:S-adenosylmethionine:tRNA ribosyltransferase-isomerase